MKYSNLLENAFDCCKIGAHPHIDWATCYISIRMNHFSGISEQIHWWWPKNLEAIWYNKDNSIAFSIRFGTLLLLFNRISVSFVYIKRIRLVRLKCDRKLQLYWTFRNASISPIFVFNFIWLIASSRKMKLAFESEVASDYFYQFWFDLIKFRWVFVRLCSEQRPLKISTWIRCQLHKMNMRLISDFL